MTTKAEKAESLLGLDERRKQWAKATNLSEGERDLVFETVLMGSLGSLKSQGVDLQKRAMTPTQKNAKASLKEKLIAGLADLGFSASYLFSPMQQRIRFYQKDLAAIYDPDKIAEIVRMCAMNLGRERKGKKERDLGQAFADKTLVALRDFYAAKGEKIMIQREVGEMPVWWNVLAGR